MRFKNKENKMELNLASVLGWGSLDINFLENKMEEFNLDSDDVIEQIESIGSDKLDINNWIYCTFDIQANKFLDKVEEYAKDNNIDFDKDDIEIEIFINYLDSFLNGNKLNSDIDVSNLNDDNLAYYLEWLKDK
jgi:hypothetical protein